jgi:hypothetical protein
MIVSWQFVALQDTDLQNNAYYRLSLTDGYLDFWYWEWDSQ